MPNYDQRLLLDNKFGQLSGGVVASATTLTSPDFTGLPSDLSAVRYIPLVLADDSSKVYEIVWAIGHVEGSANLTVVRGREGSTARQWLTGTAWRGAATARDGNITVATRSALPTDAHLGMKVLIRDENRAVEKTTAGWRATETIFGHAGRTAGIQSASGVTLLGVTAAQDMQGGVTFANGAMVVPIAGRYLITIRGVASGGTAGRYTANAYVNGQLRTDGPAIQAYKGDTADYGQTASTVMSLAAGDALTQRFTQASGNVAFGATGYDGAWIEALYVGP